MTLVTPESRDYQGDTRLMIVLVRCPLPTCPLMFSGVTHSAARAAIDGHFEYLHPGYPAMVCDAIERRREP